MKVKYNGARALRLHKMDFKPGEVKEVAKGLNFDLPEFEIIKEEQKSKLKKSSKKED